MSADYVSTPTAARGRAAHRLRASDPIIYPIPKLKRWDAKFGAIPMWNEMLSMIDRDAIARRVRVKNTTGGTLAAGTLVYLSTLKLTPQTTATSVGNPVAGASVVIPIAATYEVGQLVTIVSGGNTDVAIVTAVSGGASVTVDLLYYNHTTPVVTALPAYEVSLADADGSAAAEWVLPAAILDTAYGDALDAAEVTGLDTSALTVEALLYLSTTAGAYTATAPTGSDQIQQVVGVVKKVDASTGVILFFPGSRKIVKFGSSFLQAGAAGVADGDKGDITVSSTGTVWTIDAGVVTLAKMANIATDRLIGRDTAGTGVPEAIALANGLEFTGSTSIGIANDGVTNARLNNMAALTVKVNATNSSADPSDLAFSNDGDMLMRIGTTLTTGNFSSLTAIDIALDDALPVSDTNASAANKKVAVNRVLAAAGHVCEAVLSLTSGVAYPTSDVSAAGTLRFVPIDGGTIRLYDGTRWVTHFMSSQLSLSLSVSSGSIYDVFVYSNSGTPTLELSAAWASATTRTDALTTQDGVSVKSGATTRLWVGTIRGSGSNVCEDSKTKRFVFNHYNKTWKYGRTYNTNTNTTYGTATWREVNNGTGQVRFEFVLGELTDQILCGGILGASTTGTGANYGYVSTALDATDGSNALTTVYLNTNGPQRIQALGFGFPSNLSAAPTTIGYHYGTNVEYQTGAFTLTVAGGTFSTVGEFLVYM